MILGVAITVEAMMIGGVALFTLVLFQVLVGLRVIKLGRRHRAVHKWNGIAILGVATVHGILGLTYGLGLTIL